MRKTTEMVHKCLFYTKNNIGNGKKRKYVLEHAFKRITAKLAKVSFQDQRLLINIKGEATVYTNLIYTYIRMLCVEKLRILFSPFR